MGTSVITANVPSLPDLFSKNITGNIWKTINVLSNEANLQFYRVLFVSTCQTFGKYGFPSVIKARQLKFLVNIPCTNEHPVYNWLDPSVCRSCFRNINFISIKVSWFSKNYIVTLFPFLFMTIEYLLYILLCLFVYSLFDLMDIVILV